MHTPDRTAVVSLGPVEQLEAVQAALTDAGFFVATQPPDNSGRGRDEDFVPQVVATHDRIDVLVAGPTRVGYGALESMDPTDWWSIVAAGAGHAFRMARACAPALTASGGSIVFVSSQAAIRGSDFGSAMSASAGAIVGLTRALAMELAPVRVNAVAAGLADDDVELEALSRATSRSLSDTRTSSSGMTLLGRLASHAEIAATVAFLASPQATYITGEVIEVNGGRTQR